MSDRPQRTNTYTAEATTDRYRQCLFDWLAAQPPLWNQINYRRRQAYFSDDDNAWDSKYTGLNDEYAPLHGKETCQKIARKNSEAGSSHFRLLDQYHEHDWRPAEFEEQSRSLDQPSLSEPAR